jgi:hypothetical protein
MSDDGNIVPLIVKRAAPRKPSAMSAISKLGQMLDDIARNAKDAAAASAKPEVEIERLKRRIEWLERGFDVRHAVTPLKDRENER